MISLTHEVAAAMIAQARREAPRECCGVLAGRGEVIDTVFSLGNAAATPERNYEAAPAELFQAMRAIRTRGLELLGIYHSHPRSPAYPSPTDVDLAFYPGAVYFIISLASQEPELKGFRICDRQISTVEYKLINPQDAKPVADSQDQSDRHG